MGGSVQELIREYHKTKDLKLAEEIYRSVCSQDLWVALNPASVGVGDSQVFLRRNDLNPNLPRVLVNAFSAAEYAQAYCAYYEGQFMVNGKACFGRVRAKDVPLFLTMLLIGTETYGLLLDEGQNFIVINVLSVLRAVGILDERGNIEIPFTEEAIRLTQICGSSGVAIANALINSHRTLVTLVVS